MPFGVIEQGRRRKREKKLLKFLQHMLRNLI